MTWRSAPSADQPFIPSPLRFDQPNCGNNDGDFKGSSEEVFEESGQIYKGKFWIEAQKNEIFKSLEEYQGKIHLVYGESDKFISQKLRDKTIQIVKDKDQPFMVLKGQDHSSWEFESHKKFLKKN